MGREWLKKMDGVYQKDKAVVRKPTPKRIKEAIDAHIDFNQDAINRYSPQQGDINEKGDN